MLKLFPGGSPAQDLVERTVSALTFGIIHGDLARLNAAIAGIGIALVLLSFHAPLLCAVLLIGHVVLKNPVTVAAVVIASSRPRAR